MSVETEQKQIAQKSAQAMWESDTASKYLGMELLDVDQGYAKMSLTIKPEFCNGHGICHGGIIFTFADSCFAFACNSYNERVVSQHSMITFLRPTASGETLIGEAFEISRGKNSGIYDIKVKNSQDKICAEMRGFSRKIEGRLFEE